MLPVILAATLNFTISPYEADSLDCEVESTKLENVVSIRLYGAPRYHSTGMPWLIRQRPAVPGPDTLIVDDSEPGWSYWVTVVDWAGNESCRGRGITVGVPTVGVGPRDDSVGPGEEERYYDLFGARLRQPPTAPGVYWKRVLINGKWRSTKIVVMVKTP